jgi:hypothetical protein
VLTEETGGLLEHILVVAGSTLVIRSVPRVAAVVGRDVRTASSIAVFIAIGLIPSKRAEHSKGVIAKNQRYAPLNHNGREFYSC